MTDYFVKTATITGGSAPSDGNDGLDPIGFGLATATYTHSSGNVLKTSAFTSYVWTAGDQIYLASSTGAWSGLVEVLSKTDADNIVVDPVSGGDDQTDVTSSDGPWAGIQQAIDNISNDDTVFICADGTHAPTTGLLFASGDAVQNVIYTGASARGIDDGTQVTISGSSLPAATHIWNHTVGLSQIQFRYLRLTAATENCFTTSSAGNFYYRCRLDNASGHGYRNTSTSGPDTFLECEFDHNGVDGINRNASSRGNLQLIRCSIHHNTGDGANHGRGPIIDSLFYQNGSIGLLTDGSDATIQGCVFFANGSDGLNVLGPLPSNVKVSNCIMADNGGYGINIIAAPLSTLWMTNNCTNNNTSGHINVNGGVLPGDNNITTDPEFESEVDGSEDFTPSAGSNLIDAGINGPTA